MKRIILLATLIGTMGCAMLMTGCGERPETAERGSGATRNSTPAVPAVAPTNGSTGLPEGHPAMEAGRTKGPRKELKLIVPESVKARWKAVTLEISGEGMTPRTIRVMPGQTMDLGHGGLSLDIGPFLPCYVSDFDKVTSDGDELKNPALNVAVLRNGKLVEKGWLFRDYARFNTLSNQAVTLRLVAAHE